MEPELQVDLFGPTFFSDDKENVVSVLFRSVDRAVVWLEHMWLNEQSGRDSGLSHCDHTCLLFSFHILDMCGRTGLGFRFSFSSF